ncbi:hypothetical protein B0H15DRAFT_958852 [Mycena belliarum]|uniref:Uncharacterized protein n=1 Tax=Mycena belliarum TaxID=1033014 RepID=A0AAD6TL40_9AGAR|nr:hypothetical protein B0H15DRAFT_958852 [Mycena belliae]
MALEASRCLHTPTALANASPPPPATPPPTCRRPCRASPALESSHLTPVLARCPRPLHLVPRALAAVRGRSQLLPSAQASLRRPPLRLSAADTSQQARRFDAPAQRTSCPLTHA